VKPHYPGAIGPNVQGVDSGAGAEDSYITK
jgi:hypothetical protein